MKLERLEMVLGEDEVAVMLPMLPERVSGWRLDNDVLSLLNASGEVVLRGQLGSMAKNRLRFLLDLAVIEFRAGKPARATDVRRVM